MQAPTPPGVIRTTYLSGPVVYRDHGGDHLPAAVLVHGIGGSGINWSLLAPLLAARFHVLALDLPGFGETPLGGRHAGLEAQRDLVARFLETVAGPPALLVGHSMGGLITAMVAAARPELVHHAVLFDPAFPPTRSPAPGLPKEVLDAVSRAPSIAGGLGRAMVRLRGAERMVHESFQRTCGHGAELPDEFVADHVRAEAERMRFPGAYVGYMQAWASFRKHFSDLAALEATIGGVTTPTLLVHGREDPVVLPAAAARLSELQPGWRLVFMEGVGHNPIFEAPRASADAILGWLEGFKGDR